jgi:hypothetical protein
VDRHVAGGTDTAPGGDVRAIIQDECPYGCGNFSSPADGQVLADRNHAIVGIIGDVIVARFDIHGIASSGDIYTPLNVSVGGADRCIEAVFGDVDVVGLDANQAERAVVDTVNNAIDGVVELREVGRGCIYAVPGVADG